MNYLRVLPKISCLGAAILCFAGTARAQDTILAPVCDYWPTKGWRESAPEQQGMDSQMLAKIRPYVEKELPQIRSVLIVRHGYLVYEQYFQYFDRDYRQSVMSVTKSISSALVGIALKEGYLKNLDQRLVDFFPEYTTPEIDPLVQKITLKHLLTMSSGFDSGDIRWKTTQEKIRQRPIHEPGEVFHYDNDAVDLLAPILIRTTHMSLLDFAKKYLFDPLGIYDVTWDILPLMTSFGNELYHHTFSGISLKPRDMAKFGYLYLNNGIWDGRQIVPSEFVGESTQKQIKTNTPSGSEYVYGYLWWLGKREGYPFYAAAGLYGQFILVFSDLDMVIVITSGAKEGYEKNLRNLNIIDKFIIPAILR